MRRLKIKDHLMVPICRTLLKSDIGKELFVKEKNGQYMSIDIRIQYKQRTDGFNETDEQYQHYRHVLNTYRFYEKTQKT